MFPFISVTYQLPQQLNTDVESQVGYLFCGLHNTWLIFSSASGNIRLMSVCPLACVLLVPTSMRIMRSSMRSACVVQALSSRPLAAAVLLPGEPALPQPRLWVSWAEHGSGCCSTHRPATSTTTNRHHRGPISERREQRGHGLTHQWKPSRRAGSVNKNGLNSNQGYGLWRGNLVLIYKTHFHELEATMP